MMTLMCHIVRSSMLIEAMRDVGHVVLDTSNDPSLNTTTSDHDDEGDDHDYFGSTTPSDHDQGIVSLLVVHLLIIFLMIRF